MGELYEFLKKAGVWFLATDDQGQPHVRPMSTQLIYQRKFYFQTGLKKKMAQ
ncbi:pyridoxamine 5'-phosphate oxidase family protein [Absicoccus intestinalis]|uniref:Pyridoxamine 5'-phosphate oxidase family protein n=1 Tax=Absicoccus intestinalis TaxID=2926319 RepID=A0ABU4WL68_9FIRM|nr:pyridoxamine 5'-phosphate oxidase family protein [Absicoccus sp. CLA-KB-P134]MDX8417272.1 pyridoxamine 5'-phosphate oxidase family protein [Absicoccus sp. CLA-KB-P134]